MGTKRYTDGFKIEALKQVTERGLPISEVAKRLGVSPRSMYAWLRKQHVSRQARKERQDTDLLRENQRLRVKLRRVEEERDILKKAPAGAWAEAFQLSGVPAYREKAEAEKMLSSIRPEFRELAFSGLMIQHIIDEREFTTVLDIGSGAGEQAAALRKHGKIVTELDYGESPYFRLNPDGGSVIVGDFVKIMLPETYDCVLMSHILEHQLNTNITLKKVHSVVREGGIVAISVPPMKHQIVGGHVSLWNAGLLLYNLVLAGFNCRQPWIRKYGYNISVVIQKRTIAPKGLVFDNGDIDRLSEFLPEGLAEGFNGDIRSLG